MYSEYPGTHFIGFLILEYGKSGFVSALLVNGQRIMLLGILTDERELLSMLTTRCKQGVATLPRPPAERASKHKVPRPPAERASKHKVSVNIFGIGSPETMLVKVQFLVLRKYSIVGYCGAVVNL